VFHFKFVIGRDPEVKASKRERLQQYRAEMVGRICCEIRHFVEVWRVGQEHLAGMAIPGQVPVGTAFSGGPILPLMGMKFEPWIWDSEENLNLITRMVSLHHGDVRIALRLVPDAPVHVANDTQSYIDNILAELGATVEDPVMPKTDFEEA